MPEPTSWEALGAMIGKLEISEERKKELLNETSMQAELCAKLEEMRDRMQQGGTISWEDVAREMDTIAVDHGHESGLPMPHLDPISEERGHRLVLADHAPLRLSWAATDGTEMAQGLAREGMAVRNSWDTIGDFTACMVDTPRGLRLVKEYHAGNRLRKLMQGVAIRLDIGIMTAEAELRALALLKTKINSGQYDSYVLGGVFLERSPKSDLHYLFRKGLPTLAVSFHGKGNENGGVLAALCLHPMGYYEGTHVGTMTPTDEVIAALLMMRGDEAKFWAKSGQWSAYDPRSGI